MGTAIDISHLRSIKDRFSFEGKKGFVTGAAGGIGRSTAAALAELGADVALVDINLERARQNAEEINKRFGTHCIALRCDVSDPNSVSTMMAEVLRAYGEVNFVHSNAGIISPDDNGDMPLESWNRMLGVNLTGMMLVDQAAAHQMKAQGKGGAVVNTASMSAHIVNEAHGEGARHSIGYTATKAGVLHLTKSFAMDFCRDHIRFNSISPAICSPASMTTFRSPISTKLPRTRRCSALAPWTRSAVWLPFSSAALRPSSPVLTFWSTVAIASGNCPSLSLSDGPAGFMPAGSSCFPHPLQHKKGRPAAVPL